MQHDMPTTDIDYLAVDYPDDAQNKALRPQTFAEFVGQSQACTKLQIFVQAAKERNESLDHTLFSGPPGLGKTTLASIIAQEMHSNIRMTSGPALTRAGDLAALLTNLQERDVLFIDEIHRLHISIEEMLYPAMEDRQIDLMIGEGPGARSVRLTLPNFTLVGATTRTGLLSAPMRDRFGINVRLDYYTQSDLVAIILRSSALLNMTIEPAAAMAIAHRSRGTPRVANRLLRRIRDVATVASTSIIHLELARQALEMLNIDQLGLDELDRLYLNLIDKQFQGGPVGIDTISAALSEQKDTLTDMVEPYLLQQGLIQRTARGRIITPAGTQHLRQHLHQQLHLPDK